MSVKNSYYNRQNLMRKQNFDLTLRKPERLFSKIQIAQNILQKKTQHLLDKKNKFDYVLLMTLYFLSIV